MVLQHAHPVDPERVARARERGISADDAARLSSLLSLLADPVRSRILYALDLVEELCVGDLALALDASEDAVELRAAPAAHRRARADPQGRAGSCSTGSPTTSPSRCSSTACAS